LDRLNDWIDGLALEGLTIPTIARVTWNLGSGTARLHCGNRGDRQRVETRSVRRQCQHRLYSSTLSPIRESVRLGHDERAVSNHLAEAMQATAPTGFYDTMGELMGHSIVADSERVDARPGSSARHLSEVTLVTTITLPKGYRRFFGPISSWKFSAFSKRCHRNQTDRESSMTREAANLRMVDLGFDAGCRRADLATTSPRTNRCVYPGFVGGSAPSRVIATSERTVVHIEDRHEGRQHKTALYPTPGQQAWIIGSTGVITVGPRRCMRVAARSWSSGPGSESPATGRSSARHGGTGCERRTVRLSRTTANHSASRGWQRRLQSEHERARALLAGECHQVGMLD
jgi:hypothetical protein